MQRVDMIDMNEYWRQLKDSLDNYEYKGETDEADTENFKKQKATLQSMWTLGTKLESLSLSPWNLPAKKDLGKQLNNIPKTAYSDSNDVPLIVGPISCDFAEKVYLPFLQRFATVDLGKIARLAPEGLDPETLRRTSQIRARILQERIAAFKNPASTITESVQPSIVEEDDGDDDLLVVGGIKTSVPEHKSAEALDNTEEEQLRLKQKSLLNFCDFLDYAQTNPKLASEYEKSTLKNILDPYNSYTTLSDCLDGLYLGVVKPKLLKHEENNTWYYRSLYYRPFQALKDCCVGVLSELSKVNKRLAAIEEEKAQQAALAAAEEKSQQMLGACLDELLRGRTQSFMDSDKCNFARGLQNQLAQKNIANQKDAIANLRQNVSHPRHENKWYVRTKGRTPTSLGIFNKYFDEQNNPKPLPAPKSSWFAWLWSAPKTPSDNKNSPEVSPPPRSPRKGFGVG